MPVVGLESEFKVFIDDEEVVPEEVWRAPSSFIDRPMLRRTSKASQLPTGGAVYFDGGVLEVVTPVIEIGPQCTGRVTGSSSGHSNQNEACREAKRDATQKAPRHCYARHCQCSDCTNR